MTHSPCYPGHKVMATWVIFLLAMASISADKAAAQVNPASTTSDGQIELYLFAEYATGLPVPSRPPQIQAKAIASKRISCSQRRATTISGAATVSQSAIRRAKCVSAYPLNGGYYTLLASYIEGANWPTWKCYKNAPATLGADVTVAAAATAEVQLFSSQTVQLAGGSSYTCIATYTPLTPEQKVAIANIQWQTEVMTASSVADGVAVAAAVAAGDTMLPAAGSSCSPPTYTQPPRGQPAPALDIQGNRIVTMNNRQSVTLRGLNWFGFNVPMGMLDGLWAGGTDAATDFSTIVYQLKMLGYNSVRLPFAHNFLANNNVWDLERDCTKLSQSQMRNRLTDPNDQSSNSRKDLPGNQSPMSNPPGKCNTYLPKRSNMDRFMFVVQQFIAQGFYVVLDYQPQGLEPHAYNLNQFVSAWVDLWKKVTCLPNFYADIAGRVLIDVMNEPDSMGIRWEASGDRPGAEQLYLATADALQRMTPNKMLFVFEGTGQNMFGLNWGNGFITDINVINTRGLSNPISFFNQLVNRPWKNKVVFTPHMYPPTITMSTWLGEDLWKQSQVAFSYLQSPGYCTGGSCTVFPVFVGETGSAYKEENDKRWLQDFADFAFARGRAAAFNKVPLSGWMWWAYNENSGDTGGIVTNNWQDLHWEKLRYMRNSLNLAPWYATAGSQRRPPQRPSVDDAGVQVQNEAGDSTNA